jgi:hypothetical protein
LPSLDTFQLHNSLCIRRTNRLPHEPIHSPDRKKYSASDQRAFCATMNGAAPPKQERKIIATERFIPAPWKRFPQSRQFVPLIAEFCQKIPQSGEHARKTLQSPGGARVPRALIERADRKSQDSTESRPTGHLDLLGNGIDRAPRIRNGRHSRKKSQKIRSIPLKIWPNLQKFSPKLMNIFRKFTNISPNPTEIFRNFMRFFPKPMRISPNLPRISRKLMRFSPKPLRIFPKLTRFSQKPLRIFRKLMKFLPKVLNKSSNPSRVPTKSYKTTSDSDPPRLKLTNHVVAVVALRPLSRNAPVGGFAQKDAALMSREGREAPFRGGNDQKVPRKPLPVAGTTKRCLGSPFP